jgi:alpha-beta hydrolase superfamily lysophospholipase
MSNETATIVLVHGAFADASSWNGVIERLQAGGLRVIAPANRCAESRTIPHTQRACSSRLGGPCSRSAILTAAR